MDPGPLANYSMESHGVVNFNQVPWTWGNHTVMVTTMRPSISQRCWNDSVLALVADPKEYIANAYVIPVVATFGIVGNILSLMVLLSPVMRSRSQMLTYLAIVDIMFLASVLPHSLAAYWCIAKQYGFRVFYMKTKLHFMGFSNWTSAAAIWIILLICVERLIGVRYPFFVKKYWNTTNDRRRTVLLVLVLIGTFFLTFYVHFSRFIASHIFCNGTQLQFFDVSSTKEKFGRSTFNPYPKWLQNSIAPLRIFHALFGVLLPTIVIAVANIMLLVTLKLRGKFLTSFNASRKRSGNMAMSQAKIEHNITITACAIVTNFTITQAPSAIIVTLFGHLGPVEQSKSQRVLTMVMLANVMVLVGKSLNFVLFCLTSYTFRQRLLLIIKLRKFTAPKHVTGMTTYYTSLSANSRGRILMDPVGHSRAHPETLPKVRPSRSYSSISSSPKKDLRSILRIRRAYSADHDESKPRRKDAKWDKLNGFKDSGLS